MKKKYIFGNWKLNKNSNDVKKFFFEFNKLLDTNCKLRPNLIFGFAPNPLYLSLANKLKKGKTLIIAQDVSEHEFGNYTGQISCKQLKDFKIKYAIVGHSETRQYLSCDDKIVNLKVKACLNNNITPIICIGETLLQHNKKQTKQVLLKQLKIILKNINPINCIFAYEPIWSIGTGKISTLSDINNLCAYIKNTISKINKTTDISKLIVLYGGSVVKNNANDIISLNSVDGLLIGKASLQPNEIYDILLNNKDKK